MNLTTKGQYALTAMMDLAIHDRRGPIALADISHKQGISISYLEQLFSKLRKAKLVEGVRGPGGGYRLARIPAKITVAEIVTCIDEPDDSPQHGTQNAEQGDGGVAHELWLEFSQSVYNFLDGVTLDTFVDRQKIGKISHHQNKKTQMKNFILPRPAMH